MQAIDRILTKFEDIVTVFCFIAMTVVTLLGVAFRDIKPLIWAEEVSRYFMIWGIFIGLSIVTRKKAQLGIDILVSVVPEKLQKALNYISHIVLIITYIILFIISINFVMGAAKTGQLTPITRIPYTYVYLALPVGFGLCIYRSIQAFWDDLKGNKNSADESEDDNVGIEGAI